MITKKFYEEINKNKTHFILFNSVMLFAFGGALFPLVIPMTEGFSLYFFTIYIIVCFYVSSIYIGLYQRWIKVFISVLLINSAGLIGRGALEWGEYSISTYFTFPIVSSYILSVPILVTALYVMIKKVQHNKRQLDTR